jgi:4-amino-4-deoxy-L-arabinose transferase-like glycosyltransferase
MSITVTRFFGLNSRSDSYCVSIFCFALLLFFPGLGARDFWAPVEPRYAEIVRVMFAQGEWIVPTINGALYTDKPILYFWVALLAAKASGGVSEWAVRLPAASGAVGFVLTTYFIGRDFYSARVGVLAAFVLATSFRTIWEARWAHVDMLFGFFFAMTIYLGARTVLRRGRSNEILLAYVFMALATLTKGLIGIVLPGLLFASFMITRQDWSLLRLVKLPLGIPLFLFVAAPWFYLVGRASDGKWLVDFLYIHHLLRYTAGSGHRQPFYYYLTTLPVDFLPWTVFFVLAVIHRKYRWPWNHPQTQFFLLWFAVVYLFFTASDTKRDLYLLPLFPPLALLVANYLHDLAGQDWAERGFNFWLPVIFFCLVALCGLAFPLAAWVTLPEALGPLLPSAVVLALGGSATALLILRRSPLPAVLSAGAMMPLLTVAAVFWMFPYLEQFKSHRQFCAEINRLVPRSAQLYVYEDTTNDFNYYAQRETIPILDTPAEIARVRASGKKSYVLVKERARRKLPVVASDLTIAHSTLGNTTWYLLAVGQ